MWVLFKRVCGVYINDEIQHGPAEIKRYVESWKRLIQQSGRKDEDWQLELFNHMYDNLDALDNKTTSLLQFNGIMAAVYSFIASSLIGPERLGDFANRLSAIDHWSGFFAYDVFFFLIAIVFLIISIVASLQVVWVHWSRTSELIDADSHLQTLVVVRNTRTVRYRRAWLYSIASLFAMLVGGVISVFGLGSTLESLASWLPAAVLGAWIIRVHVSEPVLLSIRRVFSRG